MGSAFLRRRKLVDRARAVMQELMETTGETANLGVAEDDCVVFVSQVETHQAIRAFFRPGTRSPFHASGIGKAILAHLSARARQRHRAQGRPRSLYAKDARRPAVARARPARRSTRAAGRSTTRNGIRACAAWRRRSSTSSASRSPASPSPGRRCASRPSARPTIGPLVREAAEEVTKAIGGKAP